MTRLLGLLILLLAGAVLVFAGGEVEATGAGDEQVELTFWMPGSGQNANWAWTTLKDQFEEDNPGVSIEYALIPWAEYFTKLNASFAGGLSPDVFGLGYGQMGPVQANGHVLALDDYLEGWDGFEDIPESVFEPSRKDGQLWSVMLPDVKLLFYRTDVFEESGLDPPETTDELLEYARMLTEREDGRTSLLGFGVSTTNGEQDYFNTYLMFGGERLWDDQNRPTYNTPRGLQTIRYLNTFVQEGLAELSDEHGLTGGAFENGYAAMSVEAAGAWVNITEKLPGKVGVALPPGDVPMGGATFLNVAADSDNPEVAVELLKYLVSSDGQRVMFEGVGFIPTRKSNQEWLRAESQFGDVFAESVPLVKTYGQMNPHFFDFLNTFRSALESVYYGTASAEDAFQKAEQDYLNIIE